MSSNPKTFPANSHPGGQPRSRWKRTVLLVLAFLLLVAAGLGVFLKKRFIPPGLSKDIRAGIGAREVKDPDARLLKYLELRYGSMSDRANREKAFFDFFDPEHIRALQLLVRHSPEQHRQENVMAMARWIKNYRESMTPEERAAMKKRLEGPDSAAMLRRATAQYNSEDVRYRGMTAPVISELLRTLNNAQTK